MKTPKLLYLALLLTLLLSACGGAGNAPEAIPTVVLGQGNVNTTEASPRSTGDIVTSAVVVPAQEAHLAYLTGGNIQTVNVILGEEVKAGQILVELDNTIALLEVERAKRALRELTSPMQIAIAEEAVAIALETRDDEAHDVVALDYGRASRDMIDEVQAEITLAENRVEGAQTAYNKVSNQSLESTKRAKALLALNDAKTYLNSLRANYQWYISPPSDVDVAKTTAEAVVAEAVYQEAQWYLAALKEEKVSADASGAQLAQLQQAKDDLEMAENRLDQTRLIAPIAGTIAEINIIAGEYAFPANTLIIISDMSEPQIKTTDLSERDITKVKVGALATIFVDALNEEFSGEVSIISPIADTLGGDVIYEITLTFDEPPAGAFSGMTAEVSIEE